MRAARASDQPSPHRPRPRRRTPVTPRRGPTISAPTTRPGDAPSAHHQRRNHENCTDARSDSIVLLIFQPSQDACGPNRLNVPIGSSRTMLASTPTANISLPTTASIRETYVQTRMMPARCEGGATARGAIRIYLDERLPRTSRQLGETCREYWAKYSLHLNKNARDPADADAAFGGGGAVPPPCPATRARAGPRCWRSWQFLVLPRRLH